MASVRKPSQFRDLSDCSKIRAQAGLFDHLTGAREQRRRDREPQILSNRSRRFPHPIVRDESNDTALRYASSVHIRDRLEHAPARAPSISSKVRPLGSNPNAQNPITPRIYAYGLYGGFEAVYLSVGAELFTKRCSIGPIQKRGLSCTLHSRRESSWCSCPPCPLRLKQEGLKVPASAQELGPSF